MTLEPCSAQLSLSASVQFVSLGFQGQLWWRPENEVNPVFCLCRHWAEAEEAKIYQSSSPGLKEEREVR